MDRHGMCVFCEDMPIGYTSPNLKMLVLSLGFYALQPFYKRSLRLSFFAHQVKTSDQPDRSVVAGRKGQTEAFPQVRGHFQLSRAQNGTAGR